MRIAASGLQCSYLILKWRVWAGPYQRRDAEFRELTGARDAARASRPSWRFRFRRAPAKSSSKPAMARRTHAASTDFASDSNSLESEALRKTGSLTLDVISRRSVSNP